MNLSKARFVAFRLIAKFLRFTLRLSLLFCANWYQPTNKWEKLAVKWIICLLYASLVVWISSQMYSILYVLTILEEDVIGLNFSAVAKIWTHMYMKVMTCIGIAVGIKYLNPGLLLVVIATHFAETFFRQNLFEVKTLLPLAKAASVNFAWILAIELELIVLFVLLMRGRVCLMRKCRRLMSEATAKAMIYIAGQQSDPVFVELLAITIEVEVGFCCTTHSSIALNSVVNSHSAENWALNIVGEGLPFMIQDFVDAFPLQTIILGMHCSPLAG